MLTILACDPPLAVSETEQWIFVIFILLLWLAFCAFGWKDSEQEEVI